MNEIGTKTFGDAQCRRCREDFPSLSRIIGGYPVAYLDGPGGTQVPSAVIETIGQCYRMHNVNAHGSFPVSEELDRSMIEVRTTIAEFLGAEDPARISLGQNMTSLAFSLSRALSHTIKPGDEVLITALDHEANRGPWKQLAAAGARIREIPMLPSGALDYEEMRRLITAKARIVAVGCSSNSIGTVNDIALARQLTRETGALLILDAVHYAPHFSVDVSALDPDFLLCSAYKFYGPHVGILYSRPGLMESLQTERLSVQDEHAPYRIETGTLNHAAIEGVAAAINYIASFGGGATRRAALLNAMRAIGAYEHQLGKNLWEALGSIAGVRRFGLPFDSRDRAPTVSFTIDGVESGAAARELGRRGLCVWDGDFYAPSPVRALKVPGGALIRVGFSMYNTSDEASRLVQAVSALAA
jgi:cysteine desulfurase family protein (TIGR01976 family)